MHTGNSAIIAESRLNSHKNHGDVDSREIDGNTNTNKITVFFYYSTQLLQQ